MPCNQTSYTPGNQGKVSASAWEEASSLPSRYLVVSDAPETINSNAWGGYPHTVGQLYRCTIPIPAARRLDLRVFLWHVNEMGETKNIWIVLRTGSGTATLSDHRALAPAPPEYATLADRGICLAKAQLFGTITEAGYHTGTSLTSTSDVGLGNHRAQNNGAVTAIHEFTVTGTPGQVVDLRTIVTKDDDFGQPYDQCLRPDHIRGWWPHSELLAIAEPWDAGADLTDPGNQKHFGICEAGGKDQLVFAWQGSSADPFGTTAGNRGLFGVNARYRVRLYNTHNLVRYVSFNLRARRTWDPDEGDDPAPYFGAALGLEEDPVPTLGGVPRIMWQYDSQPPGATPYDAVRIRSSDLAVPANTPATQPILATVKNATAGSATLPVDLRLVASPIATPIENGP